MKLLIEKRQKNLIRIEKQENKNGSVKLTAKNVRF